MNHLDYISGAWTGFYNYRAAGQRHRTDLVLTFASGIIAGQGSDRVGVFGIAGHYDAELGEIQWTKTYFGAHSVRYRGFADGRAIWGTWKIGDIAKGGFHIWPFDFRKGTAVDDHRNEEQAPFQLPAREKRR